MSTTDNSRGVGPLTERDMIDLAKSRAIVRLVDGQLATLVSWGCKAGRNKVRLEGADGETRWTRPKTDIVEVVQ